MEILRTFKMKPYLKLSLIILGTDLFPSLSALQLINELIKIINLNSTLTVTPFLVIFVHVVIFFCIFDVKGSSDPSHFNFEITVGKRRIRQRTTLNLNNVIFNRFVVEQEIQPSISASLYVGSDSFRY